MSYRKSQINEFASVLLEKAGFTTNIKTITPIYGGGNNQLFHLKHHDHQFVLKKYFDHPEDHRKRLQAEYSFLELAQKKAPNYVPKAFSQDVNNSTALYEYIEGIKIASSQEIKKTHITHAAKFIALLNKQNTDMESKIKNASEACFSIDEHITTINQRLKNFNLDQINNPLFADIYKKIIHKWKAGKSNVYLSCCQHGISTDIELNAKKRILSPSDFGFHNAIVKNNGDIIFIDFEYAGWDDPAKLVGDFFSQIAVPIDLSFLDHFINESFDPNIRLKNDLIRFNLLINVYKIKWCCIVLNSFINKDLSRRLFAKSDLNINLLKIQQIQKAKTLLESINFES